MEKIKLQKEEIQKLKEIQTKANEIIFALGNLEAQKLAIIPQLEEAREERDKFGKELQDKYGNGNIDLETGTFTKSE
jgi:cysteine sulfinate desulfinase/cysteine desulfurase-like protein